MKADEAKELLEERIDFLEYDTPIISTEWIQKQYESISFAIKIIEVFEMSLHDQGAYIVDYKNSNLIINIGAA